jgi:hypothetical protein
MSYTIIDRQDVIELFHQMMKPDSPFRILRMLGEAKSGKTYLITKVFPFLAHEDHRAECHIIDLRHPTQNILDILHTLACLLGGSGSFPAYHSALREWRRRPRVLINRVFTAFSRMRITAPDAASEERMMIRCLTGEFVADIRNLNRPSLLLLFDAIDGANEHTRNWLMNTLLVQLARLDRIRILVAGRQVPEPSGSYATICRSYELLPVRDEQAYIAYCREVGATLPDQSIRDIARVFDYNPGLFVEGVLPRYTRLVNGNDG